MKFEITNKDKILFPKSKITKQDFINYYKKIAPKIIPLIKNRPITLQRFPDGIDGEMFFQKKALDYFPKWIKTINVQRTEKESINMPLVTDLDSLLYLANQVGVIHIWLSKIDKLNYPDRIVFDLDPQTDNFSKVIEAVIDLKKILDALNLPTFFMTTGSRGMHVVVPIKPEYTFDETRNFAKNIALMLTAKYPSKYTIEPRKEKRKDRVFIDYLRNAYGQTQVAPYSIRPKDKAPIATPISFKELNKHLSSQKFNIKNIFKRNLYPFEKIDSNKASIAKAIVEINITFFFNKFLEIFKNEKLAYPNKRVSFFI
jgi:bifunctional non-homologous end joining protein LigD